MYDQLLVFSIFDLPEKKHKIHKNKKTENEQTNKQIKYDFEFELLHLWNYTQNSGITNNWLAANTLRIWAEPVPLLQIFFWQTYLESGTASGLIWWIPNFRTHLPF